MKHNEWDAALAMARAEMEAHVESVLDAVVEEHDGDWAMQNAVEILRHRFAAVFINVDYDDEDEL